MSEFYKPRPDRWPQFSLRGLLIVMTLVAILSPWFVAKFRDWQDPTPGQPFPNFTADLDIPYRPGDPWYPRP